MRTGYVATPCQQVVAVCHHTDSWFGARDALAANSSRSF